MTSTSLFDPYTIGDLNLKNRIAMAPMTRGRAGDTRVPNELMAEHYFQRASAGLLVTEATVISTQGIGRVFVGDVTLFASKTARVEPQFVTGDDLVGIDDR